jgi:hypothetical protein
MHLSSDGGGADSHAARLPAQITPNDQFSHLPAWAVPSWPWSKGVPVTPR